MDALREVEGYCSIVEGAGALDRETLVGAVFRSLTAAVAAIADLPASRGGVGRSISWQQWADVRLALQRVLGDWDEFWTVPALSRRDAPEAVKLSLAEGLADIWRGLKSGLVALEMGAARPEVEAGWRGEFTRHGGRHATEALRVLHARIAGTDDPHPYFAELAPLLKRVEDDRATLAQAGIWIFGSCCELDPDTPGTARVSVEVAARSEQYAREELQRRYGSQVDPVWLAETPEIEAVTPWDSYTEVTPGELEFTYTGIRDNKSGPVTVIEDDSEVVVTVHELQSAAGVKLIGERRTVRASVSRPLDGRRVIDGATRP